MTDEEEEARVDAEIAAGSAERVQPPSLTRLSDGGLLVEAFGTGQWHFPADVIVPWLALGPP